MKDKENFIDILLPRNTQFGIMKFMTRQWVPKKTLNLEKYYSPQDIKNLVTNSSYLDLFLEAESAKNGRQKEELRKEVLKYIDEIAMDKKMHVIRWMGVFFLKVSFMMKIGIFVNEPAILKLRENMGENPILFLPTHRSYADFCVLTYLCYHYDIELPAVAAGMDFYSMAVVGQMMRETGAFYMRRTLLGARVYATALRHYVRTLVARYPAPVEFFLEGTRSRSNKSLPPKYGMLAMSLVPYFAREVADITIVPVNISYDRIMEQSLFAYEHLGVPKPKETTGGLLKALRTLNDHFGNIYINMGEPMSLKAYLGHTTLSTETTKPRELQQLTEEDNKLVQKVADHVVHLQQESTVVTITNLIAIVLMDSLYRSQALELDRVIEEVDWLRAVLEGLGACVFETDVRASLERVMKVHGSMMRFDRGRLRLVAGDLLDVTPELQKKMKGHRLRAETMAGAVGVLQLQLYVNPVLHHLAPPALLALIVARADISRDDLYAEYNLVRKLLKQEFFHLEENELTTFNKALDYCISRGVVSTSGNIFTRGTDHKLQFLLQWAVLPALTTLHTCMQVMEEGVEYEQRAACARVQAALEGARAAAACLSLPAAAACLLALARAAALRRRTRDREVFYEAIPDVLREYRRAVSSIVPELSLTVENNPAVLQKSQRARL